MPEVKIEFDGLRGVSAEMTYAREPEDSGRLKLDFSSERALREDGSPRVFSLEFNAIGKTNPEVFLASLDESYLNHKVSGLSGSRHDFFKTVMNVREMAADKDYELTADQRIRVDERIDDLAADFNGDHSLYSKLLIDGLRRDGMPCFQDDAYHLVGRRQSPENLRFHMEIWPDFQGALEDFLDANMDVYDVIEAIADGKELPVADDEQIEP